MKKPMVMDRCNQIHQSLCPTPFIPSILLPSSSFGSTIGLVGGKTGGSEVKGVGLGVGRRVGMGVLSSLGSLGL